MYENIKIIKRVMKNPKLILKRLLYLTSTLLPRNLYIKMLFRICTGYELNLKHPKTYNEKLQWLKLYYRNPLYPELVDKYRFKKYIAKHIGEEYIVNNYGVWDNFDDIDFDSLPNQFVLKTTHDQGGVIVCKDKTGFDFKKARKKLNKHLRQRKQLKLLLEWPYEFIEPRIIAEKYLENKNGIGLVDYKFYCFNGEPLILLLVGGRNSSVSYRDFYDMDFNHLDISRSGYDHKEYVKPKNWKLMIELAKKLAKNEPHVRVDFYNIEGKIYFGEYTLFSGSGLLPFYPEEWDYKLGEYLDLPERNI